MHWIDVGASGIGLATCFIMPRITPVLIVLLAWSDAANAETDLGFESHAGLGVSSGRELLPPGSLIAAANISLVWRQGWLAAELNSSLVSGDQVAYWGLGPGLRFYMPLASTIRNDIDVRLAAYARLGTSWIVRTEDDAMPTARGHSIDTGGGAELSLSPVHSMLVATLQLAVTSRFLSLTHGPATDSASGTLSALSFGFTTGVRF